MLYTEGVVTLSDESDQQGHAGAVSCQLIGAKCEHLLPDLHSLMKLLLSLVKREYLIIETKKIAANEAFEPSYSQAQLIVYWYNYGSKKKKIININHLRHGFGYVESSLCALMLSSSNSLFKTPFKLFSFQHPLLPFAA